MIRFIFLLALLIPIVAFAQKKSKKEYAHIYIMRSAISERTNEKVKIYLANEKEFELPVGGIVKYNLQTETPLSVLAKYESSDISYFCKLNIKRGNDYYVFLTKDDIEEEPYSQVSNFLSKHKTQIEERIEDTLASPQYSFEPDYSTIYIVSEEAGLFDKNNQTGSVHIGNQAPFNIEAGAVTAFRIFSEGAVTIEAHRNGIPGLYYSTLNIKRGNEYFLFFSDGGLKELLREQLSLEQIKNGTKYERRDENVDNAIYPKSLKTKKGGESQGTCFLVSQDGYLVTNFHCIDNANKITVRGIDGDFSSKFGATLIASDPSNDLALIKLNNKSIKFDAPTFQTRPTGILQGEKVYALGYPIANVMGDELKITDGIISSSSGVRKDISKIQISAAVNPGNSGGPLIDENGYLVGIIYAKSTVAESAGYAIKATYLEAFLKNIEGTNLTLGINQSKDKTFPEKIKDLKKFVFIIETGN